MSDVALSDLPVSPASPDSPKKFLSLLVLIALLPLFILTALTAQRFLPKAADTTVGLASVSVNPSRILAYPGGPSTNLSTLAYNYLGQPMYSGVTYDWGISSTGIGDLRPNGNLAAFIPTTPGSGDIWVRAFNPTGTATASVRAVVVTPFSDDFSSLTLDPARWGWSSSIGAQVLLYSGRLYLRIPSGQGPVDGNYAVAFPRLDSQILTAPGDFTAMADLTALDTTSGWAELKFDTGVVSIRRTKNNFQDTIETWFKPNRVTLPIVFQSLNLPQNTGQVRLKMTRLGTEINTYYDYGTGFLHQARITGIEDIDINGLISLVASNAAPAYGFAGAYFDNFLLAAAPPFTPYPTPVITYYPTPFPSPKPSLFPTRTPTPPVPSPYLTPTPTPTPVPQTTTIDVYAGGTRLLGTYPVMQLRINGQTVARWSNVRGNPKKAEYQKFTYTHPTLLPIKPRVRVAFTNDRSIPGLGDRNLRVDKIVINGIEYQSEDPATYGQGVRNSRNKCASGYLKTEWLYCGGYFQYSIP